jgi:RimJ/RimL family protein N-acetyltransferase
MKAVHLETINPVVELVEPDVARDAALGVVWLEGELGHSTLALMGVADKDNKPTSLEAEQERVRGFIERPDQLNWMIQYDGKVVGSVWVDLFKSDKLPAPSVHIMIGDPKIRGKGVGYSTISAVLEYLAAQGNKTVYSRHLTTNEGAKSLFESLGFSSLGDPYSASNELEWQNVSKALRLVSAKTT